jgi:hypothetical protein
LRPSMRALRWFLASVMLAFFIIAIIAKTTRLFKSLSADFAARSCVRGGDLLLATIALPF